MIQWIKKKIWHIKYTKYLKSSKWELIRLKVLVRDKCTCQFMGCNSQNYLEVHHKTYKNVFNEEFKDLITYCKKHHKLVHKH